MEKLTDSDVLARLIYRAYIAPDPHAPLEAEALLPFRAALDLYAKTAQAEAKAADKPALLFSLGAPEPAFIAGGRGGPCYSPEPEPEAEPPAADTHTHTGANDGGELTPRLFAGYGAGEKREVYARLMTFVATHGLGARRKIAEASNGALTLSEVQDMTDAKRVPLPKWRIAAAAMDRIEATEKGETDGPV